MGGMQNKNGSHGFFESQLLKLLIIHQMMHIYITHSKTQTCKKLGTYHYSEDSFSKTAIPKTIIPKDCRDTRQPAEGHHV